jgi:peptidoglycan hydrolase CwlO-like protein
MLENTLADFNDQSERLNEIKDDIEQAEEAIRVYRERIAQLEEENDAYV